MRPHLGLPELGVEAGEDGAEARANRKLRELGGERRARHIRSLANVLGLVVTGEGDGDLEEIDEHGLLGAGGRVDDLGDLLGGGLGASSSFFLRESSLIAAMSAAETLGAEGVLHLVGAILAAGRGSEIGSGCQPRALSGAQKRNTMRAADHGGTLFRDEQDG